MEYKELSVLYHMDTSSNQKANHRSEYQARFAAADGFHTGMDTRFGEMFFTTPRELSVLAEQVLCAERQISVAAAALSAPARRALLRSLVVDEVVSTNLIETVASTRREVKDALDYVSSGETAGKKRFSELVTLYLGLLEDGASAALPACPADIRALYDRVTDGEISPDKMPDGTLFRAAGVDVVAGGSRVVHRGVEPEAAITEDLQIMLDFVSQPAVPALYGSLAAHAMFEFIHPFYDGNGRTGRYLLALNLSRALSPMTVLSLSRTLEEHREAYYRAFATVQNPLNRAELTHFVYAMLDMVRTAQLDLTDRLAQSGLVTEALQRMMDAVRRGHPELPEKALQVVYLLAEFGAFGGFAEGTLTDISEYLQVKVQMARKYVALLEQAGVVEKRNFRAPVTFGLTDAFKERYSAALDGYTME